WWSDDLAFAALDATGLGSSGSTIRLHRTAIVGTLRQTRLAHDRASRCDQHSILRGNGAKDPLVAIQWLPHDFVHTVVHHSRRIRHRARVLIACPNFAARFVARGRFRGRSGWNIDFRLLRHRLFSYGSIDVVITMFRRIVALIIATLTWATTALGAVPIIVQTPTHQRAAVQLCSGASEKLRNGDVTGAKRNVDAA